MTLKRKWTVRIGAVLSLGLAIAIFISSQLSMYGADIGGYAWLERCFTASTPHLWQSITESLTREAQLTARWPAVDRAIEAGDSEQLRAAITELRGAQKGYWAWVPEAGTPVESSPGVSEAARRGTAGWFSFEQRPCLSVRVARPGGQLLLAVAVDETIVDKLQLLTATEVAVLDGKSVQGVSARDAQKKRVELVLRPEQLAQINAAEERYACQKMTLSAKGYDGYEGKEHYGAGDRVSTYACFGPLAPGASLPHRLLFFVPTAVLTTGTLYGIGFLVLIAALVLLPVLLLVLSRLLDSALGPIAALSRASAEVAAGKLDTHVDVQADGEIERFVRDFNAMTLGLKTGQAALIESERRAAVAPLQKEMEIASRIQSSILPVTLEVPGYEVVAQMLPATDVGGDYYDVRLARDGTCWLGIGDVAGHGVTSGLVMLMTQSGIAALVEHRPELSAAEVLASVNRLLFDNVRLRLRSNEHVTLCLMKMTPDGKVEFAGAHEDIVVIRADGSVERVETTGTWLGAVRDIQKFCPTQTLWLRPGDLMLLHSDGVTEAPNARRERLGLERVIEAVAAKRNEPVHAARDVVMSLVSEWQVEQEDDVTVMVIRYVGQAKEAAA